MSGFKMVNASWKILWFLDICDFMKNPKLNGSQACLLGRQKNLNSFFRILQTVQSLENLWACHLSWKSLKWPALMDIKQLSLVSISIWQKRKLSVCNLARDFLNNSRNVLFPFFDTSRPMELLIKSSVKGLSVAPKKERKKTKLYL